jgi:hypothetical protein
VLGLGLGLPTTETGMLTVCVLDVLCKEQDLL